MRKRGKLILTLTCAAAVAAVVVPTASAGATECNASYTNTTLKGGVVVNSGDVCTLDNVTVNGGLTVNGGSISVTDSTVHGGWSITGDVSAPTYMCGNTINGGLAVNGVTSSVTLAFGEANAKCAGGTINGSASIADSPGVFAEIDQYRINGGVTITGTGGGELEGTSVNGSATCQTGIGNDEGGPNSFTGSNNGCPA